MASSANQTSTGVLNIIAELAMVTVIVASLYAGLQMVRLGYNSALEQGKITKIVKAGVAEALNSAGTAIDTQSNAIKSLSKVAPITPTTQGGSASATTSTTTVTTIPPQVSAGATALGGLSKYVDSLSGFAKSLQGLSPSLQYFLVSTILFVLAAAVALLGLRYRSG